MNVDGVQTLWQFLVEDYRSDAWYWELIEMWRKLVVGGLLMFVRRGSLLQLLLAIVLELCFLAAVAWCARPLTDEVLFRFSHRWRCVCRAQPFTDRRANLFKIGTELALLLTLVTCVLLRVGVQEQVIAALLALSSSCRLSICLRN